MGPVVPTCVGTNGLTVPDVGSMHSSAVSYPDDTGTISAISDPGHAVGAISCPISIRGVTHVAPVNSVGCVAIAVGNRRIAVAVSWGIPVVVIIAVAISAIAVWIAVAISVPTSVVRGGKCSPNQGTGSEPEPGTAPPPTAPTPTTVAPAAMEAKGPSLRSRWEA